MAKNKGLTVRMMKERIREKTQQLNLRFYEAKEAGHWSPQLDKIVERLRTYGSKPSITRQAETIGLGFSGKRKNALSRQLSELTRVLDSDIWTPAGEEEHSAKEQQAYESFKSNNLYDWDFEKWKRFVDTFGNISDTLKNQFGYETKSHHKGSSTVSIKSNNGEVNNRSLMEAYSFAYDNHVDILSLMNEVDKMTNGRGYDQKQSYDLLYELIKERVGMR